ncbi:MAG: FAD-dependent oxidoreductase [Alphaproteobacteria bacterium]|nr:FAD-dependent oxidoreductase [Alphaproteobacteria bacterium]MCB9792388.1 FAD-dependent oxidoreductase [Alphaproteobacteria bacterium]
MDLLIIGGGAAGLSAALVAGRGRLRTTLVDAGAPRNAVVDHTHGLFTRDGASPRLLREEGRRQLERYPTVQLRAERVLSLDRDGEGFLARCEGGEVLRARRVLLATGFRDDLDAAGIPGLREVWGSAVFPCPFCDGFELAEQPLAVFAPRPTEQLAHYLMMVSTLSSPRLTLFTHGQPVEAELERALARKGLPWVRTPIRTLESEGGRLLGVRTEDGVLHPLHAGFMPSDFSKPACDLAAMLGVPDTEGPFGLPVPKTDGMGRTEVPGLFVAGDARQVFGGLTRASADGSVCAQVIVGEVAEERWHG